MNARQQILTLALVLAAGAAAAALSRSAADPARPATVPGCAAAVAEPAIARIVVIGRRPRPAIAGVGS
jgi:hypothetical protein